MRYRNAFEIVYFIFQKNNLDKKSTIIDAKISRMIK